MELLSDHAFLQVFSDPASLIKIGGIVLLLVIIYLETGFFLGLVLPGGDYLVFTAGLLAGTHYLDIPIYVLVLLMIAAAILGDFTGYAKGKWLGPKLFNKEENRIFKRSYLEKSRKFYEKYRAWAFIIARFLPVVRTLVPMVAGASAIPLAKFSFYNIAGAIIWIATLAPIGYFLGNQYPDIMKYSVYFLIGFIVIASTPVVKTFWSSFRGKVS